MTGLLIAGAEQVLSAPGSGAVRADAMRLPLEERRDVWMHEGRIADRGADAPAPATTVDASGCTVVPGFVDPHTHLPFFGWRADEDAARLSGVRYESIHREEGGIFRSARLLAEATDDDVLTFAEGEARAMLAGGTTTFEMKSGYGLSVSGELRQLRLARALGERVPQSIATTCLAAHAVPQGKSQGEWVGEAAQDLLPQVAAGSLATACDVYVETIAFALEHAARLADAAAELGLAMRVHADQLADNQTASFATRWGFRSADHLNHTSSEGVGDLAQSDTAAVLLPGATFTLRQSKRPPARDLLDRGAIVALGSDFNPGTSPVSSMPFVIALACRVYGFGPTEALIAATANAAYVLGLDNEVGRLAPGLRGDAVVLDVPSFEHVAYRPDRDHVAVVICGGEIAHVRPGQEHRVGR